MPVASAIHVFGRHLDESHRPARQMSVPTGQRQRVGWDPAVVDQLTAELRHPTQEFSVPALDDADCDGCADTVVRDQERWRHDQVRVIRPHYRVIDAQVMLLPLRHVVSLADLTGSEIASMVGRLDETLDQFTQSAGSSGLSCFANDGARAGQHTPHVHLHVFGRSRAERTNPFTALATRARR